VVGMCQDLKKNYYRLTTVSDIMMLRIMMMNNLNKQWEH
jgi:hypothetical protein